MEMDVNKPCDKLASHAVSFLSAPDILVTYSVLTTLFRRHIETPRSDNSERFLTFIPLQT